MARDPRSDSPGVFNRGGSKRRESESAGPGIDQEVAIVAGKQFGVISIDQLLALGLSRRAVQRRADRGLFHRIHRGVYAVGHTRIVPRGHLHAALLATGPDAFLSHRTAAAVFGLRAISTRQIEVTSPGRPRKRRGRLLVHEARQPVDPRDLAVRDNLRVSSVPRLLIELAPRERRVELGRLITQGVRRSVLDISEMEEALDRHDRRPGVGKLKSALAGYLTKHHGASGLEEEFSAWLETHPEIETPVRNVHIGPWEIDFFWSERSFALELDGRPYHVAVADMERDRTKDAYLQRNGITVMRVTDRRFELDRRGILDDLRAFTLARTA